MQTENENHRIKLFPKTIIATILKNNGVKNILDSTLNLVNEVISKISLEIAKGAIKLTKLKGIKTVKNDAIEVSTLEFLGKKINNLEIKLFPNSQIRKIMEESGVKRISKESLIYFNEIISKMIEEIALGVAKIIYTSDNQIEQSEAVKLSTQSFLGVNKISKEEGG